MAKKFSELGAPMRYEGREGSDGQAGKLLAASILAIAAMMVVFDDDEDEDGPGGSD